MSQVSVLLIEDDEVFQSLVCNYLQQLDYRVDCAVTGREGIASCRRQLPDVILCDLKLPDISGLQVIQQLLSEYSELPIIVVSASEQMSDIQDAVSLGAWDYLVKPIDSLNVINDAIHHCLNRYQLEETYLHDRYELDGHIDILYQDDVLVERLKSDLLPSGSLQLNHYRLSAVVERDQPAIWVDFRQLLEGQVLVIAATAHNATEQGLIPLLVLKTLVDPIIRQYLARTDGARLAPQQLMTHLNSELCHSRIRAAFDVVIGVLDTQQHCWQWSQAGDQWLCQPQVRPDLALGIWQHASFHQQQQIKPDSVMIKWPGSVTLRLTHDSPQIAE